MGLGAEVKVRRERVLEELNEKVTTKEQSHGSDNRFGCSLTLMVGGPNAYGFRQYLDKDSCQHETCTESNEVFQESFTSPVCPAFDEHKPADDIGSCRQKSEEKKASEFETSEQRFHQTLLEMLIGVIWAANIPSRTRTGPRQTRGEQELDSNAIVPAKRLE